MYWDEPYRKLNLTPLDEYIHNCVWNRSRDAVPLKVIPTHPAFRAIGASTWMAVCAAWTICDGRDVLLIAENLSWAEHLMIMVKDYTLLLSPKEWEGSRVSVEAVMKERIKFSNGTCVYYTALRRHERFKGVVFDDNSYKARAIRRALGPFAMTQIIRLEDFGKYNAYAEEDELLMELTAKEAAQLVMQRRDDILCSGFVVDKDGHIHPVGSAMRGAAVFGMEGVTKSIGVKKGLVKVSREGGGEK